MNEYDFDYSDSKDSTLVQLADFIGGSINRFLTDPSVPNYYEMLRAKIMAFGEFPNKKEPYWGATTPEECKFDKDIYSLSVNVLATLFLKMKKLIMMKKEHKWHFLDIYYFKFKMLIRHDIFIQIK